MKLTCEWNNCGQEFNEPGKLYAHLSEEHCNEQDESDTEWHCRWLGCTVCVDRKYRLISHLLTHTPYRPYSCKYCPKTFKRSHDMKKHIRLSHPSHYDERQHGSSDTHSMEESIDMMRDGNSNLFVKNQLMFQQQQQRQQQIQQQQQQQMQMHMELQHKQYQQRLVMMNQARPIQHVVVQEQSPRSLKDEQRNGPYDGLVARFMKFTPSAH